MQSSSRSSLGLPSRPCVAALLVAGASSIAMADLPANTAWYSGDPNLTGWGNQASTSSTALQHWQPFQVTSSSGWLVDTVFSLGSAYDRSTAEWSIRSGMSSGVAGTTIAGGFAVPTVTNHLGFDVVQVDIPDLFLPQGTYWLLVTAKSGAIMGTNGANSIGPTTGLHSIRNWPLFSQNYQPYSDATLSSGLTLTVAPLPGAAVSGGATLAGFGVLALVRRRRNSVV